MKAIWNQLRQPFIAPKWAHYWTRISWNEPGVLPCGLRTRGSLEIWWRSITQMEKVSSLPFVIIRVWRKSGRLAITGYSTLLGSWILMRYSATKKNSHSAYLPVVPAAIFSSRRTQLSGTEHEYLHSHQVWKYLSDLWGYWFLITGGLRIRGHGEYLNSGAYMTSQSKDEPFYIVRSFALSWQCLPRLAQSLAHTARRSIGHMEWVRSRLQNSS